MWECLKQFLKPKSKLKTKEVNIMENFLPSECYSHRKMLPINGIVIHFISAVNVDKENKYDMQTNYDLFVELNMPEKRGTLMKAGGGKYYASAHYLVGRDGEVWNLVPTDHQAWHAGKSEHMGRPNCNSWTIGIEVIGEYGVDYEEEQYDALVTLIEEIMEMDNADINIERNLVDSGLIGHEHIATPAGRKKDPGPTFDWELLWDKLGV